MGVHVKGLRAPLRLHAASARRSVVPIVRCRGTWLLQSAALKLPPVWCLFAKHPPVLKYARGAIWVGGIAALWHAVMHRVIAPLEGIRGSNRPHSLLLLGAVRGVGRQFALSRQACMTGYPMQRCWKPAGAETAMLTAALLRQTVNQGRRVS